MAEYAFLTVATLETQAVKSCSSNRWNILLPANSRDGKMLRKPEIDNWLARVAARPPSVNTFTIQTSGCQIKGFSWPWLTLTRPWQDPDFYTCRSTCVKPGHCSSAICYCAWAWEPKQQKPESQVALQISSRSQEGVWEELPQSPLAVHGPMSNALFDRNCFCFPSSP